jgi:hypothetical protein
MLARMQAKETDQARQLFMQGIDTLMAGNQFRQAMVSAGQYLGTLESDPQTLRYMARQALAAGYPAQAALYARALVFQTDVFAP